MLGNARTRLPFPGVAGFYRALRDGATGDENNPIFYVSSSPWNLYDVISEFMDLQEIPRGPILLRDWDYQPRIALVAIRHFDHKGVAIRNIMQMYPELPFILIGDTSQHDPEIYRQFVEEFPGRIPAIYIRDVTQNAERSAAVRRSPTSYSPRDAAWCWPQTRSARRRMRRSMGGSSRGVAGNRRGETRGRRGAVRAGGGAGVAGIPQRLLLKNQHMLIFHHMLFS